MDELLTLRLFWGLGFLFFVSVVFNAILLLRLVWRNATPLRSITQKSILAASSMALCFFLLEFSFSYLIVQSDGYRHTLSSELWFRRYWHPINNEGYRDYQTKHLDGRSVLFVVGDSFVAGHGVKRIVDRFPNRLAEMLGDKRWTPVFGQVRGVSKVAHPAIFSRRTFRSGLFSA